MKLVFASSNKNKIFEIQSMLPETIQILSLEDIGCMEEIPETADSIEGNAILKANYQKLSRLHPIRLQILWQIHRQFRLQLPQLP